MNARLDHLVVIAASLDEGSQWCEATLGVSPGAGGQHPLMGTHNRLLRVATVDFPRAYLEIIAIDPQAAPVQRTRWFDMDDPALLASVRSSGPRLAHFVASVPDLHAALAGLRALGIDRGEALAASRMTPRGLLQWQIAVRSDGQRLFDGCLPTLIEWGATHPAAAMPDSGVSLQALVLSHPQGDALRRACDAIGLAGVSIETGSPRLSARFLTPKGPVRLDSNGR